MATARPSDLRVDDAFAVLAGDGELLLESEGRHEKVDEGPGVSTTDGGPDHGGVPLKIGYGGNLGRSVGWLLR